MDNRPVLFIDSGLGGIPYCREFIGNDIDEPVYYLADCENFPYGPRKKEDLISIISSLTEKMIKKINPKIVVLACNTASISAIVALRQTFAGLLFVGTVPAIKPASIASKSGKVGVLGTERTIADIRGLNLSECEIFGVAAPELVDFIERRFDFADENEKTQIVKKYLAPFHENEIDTLVLGCTHFLYLLKEFKREAYPSMKIFDSLDGITKRIEHLLDENEGALRAQKGLKPDRFLVLTGMQKPDSLWENRARALGFKICLLNEL